MVKTKKETARKVPATSTNSKRIGVRNAKKQDDVNCVIAGAKTSTNKTTILRHNNNRMNELRIRKCVVKLKRIKLNAYDVAAKVRNKNSAPSVQSSGNVASTAADNAATVANKEALRIRKCVVRIKRINLQENNDAEKINKDDHNGVPIKSVPNTVTENFGDESFFEPARNSTMCTVSREPTARSRVPKNPVPCLQENVTVSKPRFFHRDQPGRTRSSITRNVFEFLSQSQIEDKEENDPAADIIKRMVKEGKACVMTRKKGKSRVRAIRKRVRPVGKRRQCSLRSIGEKPDTDAIDPLPPVNQPLSPIYEPQMDSSDDDIEPNEPVHQDVPVQVHSPRQSRAPSEGAYSPLARSLLLNQTKIQNPKDSLERRRELLNMAKKFISTPMNRKSNPANAASTSTFSPIDSNKSGSRRVATINSPNAGSSPWRVDDNASLPNTFVFGLNTSQLPSYSSDFIRGRRHVYVPDKPVPDREELATNEPSSSTLANDSNGENVPPTQKEVSEAPHQTPIKATDGQENENVENYVQLPNPRLTLQHRSPLKDINILDVVVLPSWKKNMPVSKTPTRKSIVSNHVHFEQNIENEETWNSTNNSSVQTVRQQQETSNLFGFEDFLEDDIEENSNQHDANQNLTLHERLQRLQGLRPAEQELPQVSKAPMRHAYDDLQAHEPRQLNIKEMFCSTMIATPAPRVHSTDESVALFKDVDPEATFDEKKPRRTYVRERPKRKRKQRVHVLFIDSGSSDSEDSEQDSKEKSAESPKKAMPAHKRTRKDVEYEAKLNQYITSFNQECEEVEKFPLIIE